MGLNCSHDAWDGAYGWFSKWRNTVAEAAGYWVLPVTYPRSGTMEVVLIDWGHVTRKQLHGKWKKVPRDPLMVLIAHSDCDGKIYPREGRALADRLEDLIPVLPESKDPFVSWKQLTQKFIDGLRRAAERDEPVKFS